MLAAAAATLALAAPVLAPPATAARVAAAPAKAAAPFVVGIGEQHPAIFADPRWQALGLRDVRVVVSWNALRSRSERESVDGYMAAARVAGARVLLSLGHARGHVAGNKLPTVAAYAREFRAFRKRYPRVRDFAIWNEENACGGPICRNPERAARYYNAVKPGCRGCRIVAADLLDVPNLAAYARRFRRVAKGRLIWGLHNYLDANRFTTSGTRALLRATKGDVWFTETGGLVKRTNRSKIPFAEGVAHAGKAAAWVFKLAALSPRVKRVYFYQWSPVGPKATWDSALTDAKGRPRPALAILSSWLLRHAPPPSS